MFNDKLGMETATLNGSKTRTTRNLGVKVYKLAGLEDIEIKDAKIENGIIYLYFLNKWYKAPRENQPKYKVGEEVAIKQPYNIALSQLDWCNRMIYKEEAGWTNKMFVRADLMPHKIVVTDIKLERLQDISNDDCIKEGIILLKEDKSINKKYYGTDNSTLDILGYTPREAFASLIDKISGKGTWESNEWHIVYYYELLE